MYTRIITLRPKGPLDTPEETQGAALETLLFQELLALNNYFGLGYSLYYWRTATQIEVDFVLYGERGIKAFEIKRTSRMRKEMLGGPLAFKKDYPMAQCYCLYGGDKRLNIEGVEVVPIIEALKGLKSVL
ncbi:DUF4143 domain-containing protein [bacterium]|nr:DUF4143 domain-containing protein [bacterium]MBU1917647.1 DUF4143 domain-containing protein [bacterium]